MRLDTFCPYISELNYYDYVSNFYSYSKSG